MSQTPAVFQKGATALITGAASGIGLALAHRCYSYGMNLVLLDNNASTLNEVSKQLPSIESQTTISQPIDVSILEQWQQLAPKIHSRFPQGIDFLMLNAGAGFEPQGGAAYWEDSKYFEKTFAVNVLGYTNGLEAFLKMLTNDKSQPRAVVLTGSKQGITNPPSNPAYNASKAAVRSIAEHLSFDMVKMAPDVSVHMLVPGWTYTGFHTAAFKERPAGAWTSEQVVDFMLEKIGEDKFYIMCPDNEVSEELDKKRMLWTTGDITEGRPPLSRWREEWAEKAKHEMNLG